MTFQDGEVLYKNRLATPKDIKDWKLEGEAAITFPRGRMRMENAVERDRDRGVHANFIHWCDRDFPDHIAVRWDFKPFTDDGLAMIWIAAKGRQGQDLFDPSLAKRDGNYPQYHHGDIDALHASYFRRNPSETVFRTCNLRKSHGFHLVCMGADPIPDSGTADSFYRMELIKSGPHFSFAINDLLIYHWIDDNENYGPVLAGGKIGFRQMAGLIAEYANLEVRKVTSVKEE